MRADVPHQPGARPTLSPLGRALSAAPTRSHRPKSPLILFLLSRVAISQQFLASLGGAWANTPPFCGDEDRLYRWMAEPALWARLIMGDVEPRTQQRLIGLHAALHDGLDASGFMLWRTLPPIADQGLTITLRSAACHSRHSVQLPKVTIKQAKLAPSSRFGSGWGLRSYTVKPSAPLDAPGWLEDARRILQESTFPFLGQAMPVIDAAWAADRFSRTDAITHALVETEEGEEGGDAGAAAASSSSATANSKGKQPAASRTYTAETEKERAQRLEREARNAKRAPPEPPPKKKGGGKKKEAAAAASSPSSSTASAASTSAGGGNGKGKGKGKGAKQEEPPPPPRPRVVAAALETPFPEARLLRSLVAAGKDDEVLYIDAIVAERYGAAYRLLCDIVAARQAQHPDRRLIIILMAVVSSDVLGRYKRWGFSYGGVVSQGEYAGYSAGVPLCVDRLDRLHEELQRFEAAITRPSIPAPSPTSVVDDR